MILRTLCQEGEKAFSERLYVPDYAHTIPTNEYEANRLFNDSFSPWGPKSGELKNSRISLSTSLTIVRLDHTKVDRVYHLFPLNLDSLSFALLFERLTPQLQPLPTIYCRVGFPSRLPCVRECPKFFREFTSSASSDES